VSIVCGLYFGDIDLPLGEIFKLLFEGPVAPPEETIQHSLIWNIRIPRVVTTSISGAVLASCGVIFQAVLRNPLAEPYTLGVSSGAAFGASVAIFFGTTWITTFAFLGSAAALFAVLVLGAGRDDDDDVSGIILAGVIVGSILGAGLTLLKALSGDKLGAIVMWLMGSFSDASWSSWPDRIPLLIALLVTLLMNFLFVHELDILSSGRDGASLGVNVSRTRIILLSGASLAVSLVVSKFGVIGFVGLVAPHLFRVLFGPSHRNLLALSSIGGAALLCAADTIAKGCNELPVGVLTVLVGGPIFCVILWKRKN
jgi:iron complex transport system permease protein